VSADAGNDGIRRAFAAGGFSELDYREYGEDDGESRPAVGVVRFAGTPTPLEPGRRLFTFVR
jgi:hypothetical protein